MHFKPLSTEYVLYVLLFTDDRDVGIPVVYIGKVCTWFVLQTVPTVCLTDGDVQ